MESLQAVSFPDVEPLEPSAGQARASYPRVLIVAEHASAQFGGEALLPLQYFRRLRNRGVEAWMIVHARTRDELESLLPSDQGRILYVPDTFLHKLLHRVGKPLPRRIEYFTLGLLLRLLTQLMARRAVKQLVKAQRIDVVHQPIPVSPKDSSIMHHLGAPLVMGPMNGGMTYPPGFRRTQGLAVRVFTAVGRWASQGVNYLAAGKLRAETLLVANERTRRALPRGVRGRVIELVDNAVDLTIWQPSEEREFEERPVRFAYVGRLVDWKAVDLLIEAFSKLTPKCASTLEIIGDGPCRSALEAQAATLGLTDQVTFHGALPQPAIARRLQAVDVFVLPSLFEAGGAVVLEAMSVGLPTIATAWGGPTDYVTPQCGILVEPNGRATFVDGLIRAMTRLAADRRLRQQMGAMGRRRVVDAFDWECKIDAILRIYKQTIDEAQRRRANNAK